MYPSQTPCRAPPSRAPQPPVIRSFCVRKVCLARRDLTTKTTTTLITATTVTKQAVSETPTVVASTTSSSGSLRGRNNIIPRWPHLLVDHRQQHGKTLALLKVVMGQPLRQTSSVPLLPRLPLRSATQTTTTAGVTPNTIKPCTRVGRGRGPRRMERVGMMRPCRGRSCSHRTTLLLAVPLLPSLLRHSRHRLLVRTLRGGRRTDPGWGRAGITMLAASQA